MRVSAILLLSFVFATRAFAACGNGVVESGEECDDGNQNGSLNSCCQTNCAFNPLKAPDVIVGDLINVGRYGNSNGITAYAVGTTSCNVGSCWLKWISGTAEHPVIGQNMFRLKDGRFEHIGQAWLKHGFTALAQSVCGSCNNPNTGARLGVNCSDPYDQSLNANMSRMGPKQDVNALTGVFPYPDSRIGLTSSDPIYKRLQVHDVDLNPALNAGALYFVEGQYVTLDDSTARNESNNASYRPVTVGAAPNFNLTLTGTTQRQQAGITAWKDTDNSVREISIKGGDGTFILSAKATPLGGNMWHYEYAVQNLTYHRSGQSFTVPIQPGATITNVGFHDVDYHSGEPFSGVDWTPTVTANSVSWATETFAVNPNANALRWGTLYNFRFDANVPPGLASVTIGLFRPGTPASVSAVQVAPGVCGGAADGGACDDLNACTATSACASNQCVGANPVTCTASDQCHDAGVCQAATGTCTNPSKTDGTGCNDANACTQTDTCQSGTCFGANPVTCTALDQCHDAGTCQAGTGTCTNPNKANGSGCDDANACTAIDTCTAGVCGGTGEALPGDVGPVGLDQDGAITTISWSMSAGSTTSSVLRGRLSDLPVGPGGIEETCLEIDVLGSSTTDAEDPGTGEGFWYLIRGGNSCGDGTYGYEWESGATGTQRQSTTCP